MAIKALPDAFARDREHVSRFLPPDVGVPVEVATVPDMRGYDVLPGHPLP